MFNKWFNQDINNVLSKRNRVVVVDESTHLDLLQKVLPTEYKVFVVNNAIEELECKHTQTDSRRLLEALAPPLEEVG